MERTLEDLKKHYKEVKKYALEVTDIPIIEERNPDYIYLMHHTSLNEEDTQDVYLNGIAYEGNDLVRTFNNLSKDWIGCDKSWAKEKADQTNMENVIVEQCKKGNFQCFFYKIPCAFFEPVNDEFYPIPIWNLDRDYIYKINLSSSRTPYDATAKKKTFYRVHPKLLLGHYDLKTNRFYRNPQYSPTIDNPRGVFDRNQIINLSCQEGYQDFVKHNEFILEDAPSPFERTLARLVLIFLKKKIKVEKYGNK